MSTGLQRMAWLFAGLLLVPFFVLAFSIFNDANSQTTPPVTRGPYMLAGGDRMMVWRIDQSTGKVSYCMRDTMSTDPKFIITRAPYCSAWSE